MPEFKKISDFAKIAGVSTRSVRNWVEDNKLNTTKETVNNKEITVIVIDDKAKKYLRRNEYNEGREETFYPKEKEDNYYSEEREEKNSFSSLYVKDAEIINETTKYNLVSMENTTFEQLINKITQLAEAKADAKEEYITKLEEELHELRAKVKELEIENKNYIIQNAQMETEIKIKDLKVIELEEKIKPIQDEKTLLESNYKQIQFEISTKEGESSQLKQNLTNINKDYENIKIKLINYEEEIKQLKEQKDHLEKELTLKNKKWFNLFK